MVEISFGEQRETADLARCTVRQARDKYRGRFGIPSKAKAYLNGRAVSRYEELDLELDEHDRLSFAVTGGSHRRGIYFIGAVALALMLTGGVYAYGFMSSSATLAATISDSNFADVSLNPDFGNISWAVTGMSKTSIAGPHGMFDITSDNDYTGDLAIAVALANTDELVKYYRQLALKIEVVKTSDNATVDINESGGVDGEDWTLLTLSNSFVILPVAGGDNLTVRLAGGYYLSNARTFTGWTSGSASPSLFCEVAQR